MAEAPIILRYAPRGLPAGYYGHDGRCDCAECAPRKATLFARLKAAVERMNLGDGDAKLSSTTGLSGATSEPKDPSHPLPSPAGGFEP